MVRVRTGAARAQRRVVRDADEPEDTSCWLVVGRDRRRASSVAAAVVMLLVTRAAAGPAPRESEASPELKKAAIEQYRRGRKAYVERRYEAAIRFYRAANDIVYSPRLHYNIGLAQEQLGRNAEAVASYERYLSEAPHAKNRQEVEQRIAQLRKQLKRPVDAHGEQPPAASGSEGGSPPPGPPTPAGGGGGGGGGGAKSGGAATSGQPQPPGDDGGGQQGSEPPPAGAKPRSHYARRPHQGFTLAFALGLGFSGYFFGGPGGTVSEFHPNFYWVPIRLGWFVHPRVALLVEPFITVQSVADVTIASGMLAGAVKLYIAQDLWLLGSVGLAFTQLPDVGGNGGGRRGLGISAGGGYEVSHFGSWCLQVELKLAAHVYPGDVFDGAIQGVAGIGLAYY